MMPTNSSTTTAFTKQPSKYEKRALNASESEASLRWKLKFYCWIAEKSLFPALLFKLSLLSSSTDFMLCHALESLSHTSLKALKRRMFIKSFKDDQRQWNFIVLSPPQVSVESDKNGVTTWRTHSVHGNHHHRHHHTPHAHISTHSTNNVLRARRGVVRMLMVVVLTFALCNLPLHARKMWQYW